MRMIGLASKGNMKLNQFGLCDTWPHPSSHPAGAFNQNLGQSRFMFCSSFCTDCQDFSSFWAEYGSPIYNLYICIMQLRGNMKQKDQHQYQYLSSSSRHLETKGLNRNKQCFNVNFKKIVRDSQPDGIKSSIPFSYLLSGTKYLGQVYLLFVSFFSERYLWLKSESSEHKRIILDQVEMMSLHILR